MNIRMGKQLVGPCHGLAVAADDHTGFLSDKNNKKRLPVGT
jgi:hypothetical protein